MNPPRATPGVLLHNSLDWLGFFLGVSSGNLLDSLAGGEGSRVLPRGLRETLSNASPHGRYITRKKQQRRNERKQRKATDEMKGDRDACKAAVAQDGECRAAAKWPPVETFACCPPNPIAFLLENEINIR